MPRHSFVSKEAAQSCNSVILLIVIWLRTELSPSSWHTVSPNRILKATAASQNHCAPADLSVRAPPRCVNYGLRGHTHAVLAVISGMKNNIKIKFVHQKRGQVGARSANLWRLGIFKARWLLFMCFSMCHTFHRISTLKLLLLYCFYCVLRPSHDSPERSFRTLA